MSIYLFDKLEKLVDIVESDLLIEWTHTVQVNAYEQASFELPVDYNLNDVDYFGFFHTDETFRIFRVTEKKRSDVYYVEGIDKAESDLRTVSIIKDKRPQNATADQALFTALEGTGYEVGTVSGLPEVRSLNFYYISPAEALTKIIETYGCEFRVRYTFVENRITSRYIDLAKRFGKVSGKQFLYGDNALSIEHEETADDVVTALIGRGKGEETVGEDGEATGGYGRRIEFTDIVWSKKNGKPIDKPAGQNYVVSETARQAYGLSQNGQLKHRWGVFVDEKIEDKEVLLQRTYEELQKLSVPITTFKASIIAMNGEADYGDSVAIIRDEIGIAFEARLHKIVYDKLDSDRTTVELGDYATLQARQSRAQSDKVSTAIEEATSSISAQMEAFNKMVESKIETKNAEIDDAIRVAQLNMDNALELAKTNAENYANNIKEQISTEFDSFEESYQIQKANQDREIAGILEKANASKNLADEAKRIGEQAKSDAASAIARANQVKTEAIADAEAQVATVNQALNTAKMDLQSAIDSVDQKARDSQASATAIRNDLNLQSAKILEQARAQTDLTNRLTTVETTANSTKTTVTELSKAVDKTTGDITSVSNRTKVVEDDLAGVKTNYTQLNQTVNTQTGQISSINQKTAQLESGLEGVTNRFENIWVSEKNLLSQTETLAGASPLAYPTNNYLGRAIKRITKSANTSAYAEGLVIQTNETLVNPKEMILSFYVKANQNAKIQCFMYNPNASKDVLTSDGYSAKSAVDGKAELNVTTSWQRVWVKWSYTVNYTAKPWIVIGRIFDSYTTDVVVDISAPALYHGHHNKEWSPAGLDFKNELATYVQNAQESSAELSRRIETADGKAVDAKAYAQQTANGFNTRIESLESYKNAEGTRAEQYLSASRTETAKQLSAERVAVASNYVAKSTYTEDARGTKQQLTEIKSTADTTKQNLANYQTTVDRKLTELTSSTQTLDGRINTASAKVDTVAGQIRTEISNVEAKIPTDLGGRNYILKSDVYATSGSKYFDTSPEFIDYAYSGKYVTISLDIKGENLVPDARGLSRIGCELRLNLSDGKVLYLQCQKIVSGTQPRERISVTKQIPQGVSVVSANKVNMYIQVGGTALAGRPKFELSSIPSDWSPAPEDINSELSSTKTLITQTAEGQTQLSNRLTTTQGKVSTAETKINQLIGDVSSKVSQRDYDSLTGRVSSAETLITQNANEITKRLTSTQMESVINSKGFATLTVVENKVRETADSFSRTISDQNQSISQVVHTSEGILSRVGALENNSATKSALSATQTEVSQLAGSYAIRNLTSAGALISGINLGANGVNRFDGRLTHITGQTLIDNAVIKSAMVDKLKTANFETGSVTANIIASEAVTANHLKADNAFFDKLVANDALLGRLVTKNLFSTSVQSIDLSADRVTSGVLRAKNGETDFNLNNGILTFNSNKTGVFREVANGSTQGLMFQANNTGDKVLTRTILGAERRGNNLTTDWYRGGFNGIVVETIKGEQSENNAVADRVNVIGDRIRFTHTYNIDNQNYNGNFPTGWVMTNYIGLNGGNVKLEPFGVQGRSSQILVGDIYLVNKDGTGNWLRSILAGLGAKIGA